MASSSRSYQLQTTYLKSTQEFNCFKEEKVSKALQEEEEKKNKQEDWLKLGLGLTSSWKKIVDQNQIPNPTLVSSSSSSQTLFCPQIELGLGFADKGSCLESRKGKEGLEGLNCYNGHEAHDHHHNNDNGTMLLPSSCQMMNPMNPSLSCENLAMSIPSDSHHYLARNNHNQSGLWFTLRSFTNRSGEALPQISKEYIRVKDENMTVLMVKKYLVTKLGLSNEAEIDISCMGESLSHIQTLKQVRDSIWLPRLVESVNSTTLLLEDSHDMTMNHLMSLIYQKHCILN